MAEPRIFGKRALLPKRMFSDGFPASEVVSGYIERVARQIENQDAEIDWSSLVVGFDDKSEIYGPDLAQLCVMLRSK